MKVIWLNSGGKDAKYVFEVFKEENPDAEIVSVILATDYERKVNFAHFLAEDKKCQTVEIPYAKTREAISGYFTSAAQCWNLELVFRSLQYALEHGFDTILSGATNYNLKRDKNNHSEAYENILVRIQNLLEIPEDKKIDIVRPVKLNVERDDRERIFDEFEKNKHSK